MQKSVQILQDAQLALNALDAERAEDNDDDLHPNDFRSRLLVANGGNGLHVQYDGEVWEDAFDIALTAIAEAAPDIVSLKFMGPDEGANGTRTHDFASLLSTNATFPNLLELYIRPTDVSNHNFVGVDETQLPALIARCPNLTELTIPHAPEADFFNTPLNSLRYLRIGMGWQLYDFIDNLSKRSNMPVLTMFDFSDSLSVFEADLPKSPATPPNLAGSADMLKQMGYDDAMLADMQKMADIAFAEANAESRFDDSYTSFADYCALFNSKALKKSAVFHCRNTYLTEAEFLQLEKLRPDLQFSLSIEAPHIYVSHWQGKFSKPYQHLIINNQAIKTKK
jgi:hypothetical protein